MVEGQTELELTRESVRGMAPSNPNAGRDGQGNHHTTISERRPRHRSFAGCGRPGGGTARRAVESQLVQMIAEERCV